MARDHDTPPDGELFIVDGDGSPDSGPPARAGHEPPRAGRRIAAALAVAAIFVFGVVVGRTSNPGDAASGGSAPSPSVQSRPPPATSAPTAPSRSESKSTSMSTSPALTAGSSSAAGTPAPMLNPALISAIQLPIPGRPPIQSMAAVGDTLTVLTPGWLVAVASGSQGGLHADAATEVGLPVGDPDYASWELLSDGAMLWALAPDPGRRLYAVDPSTLRLHFLSQPPEGVVDAAAIDGRLYLNTDVGVFDATPASLSDAQPVARGGQAMAADPTRHRLLLLNRDTTWAIHAYAPPGFHPAVSAALPFQAQSIAVADGQIWVTGTRNDPDASRPVLARLDPTTLRVVAHSELERALTSVPTIVAHGRALWVRSKAGGDQLWCINPRSGAVAQHWPAVPGMLAVADGEAFVAAGSVIGRLDATACTG